jgi:hypothetical protein
MKLASILLLGANLVAVPCAAAADDGDNWLKANLAEIKQESQIKARSTKQVAAQPKTTLPSKRTTQRATTAANNKPYILRAFQPGRALPRQRDLVMQYAQVDNSLSAGFAPAQQATMDPSQLNGRICAFKQPAYEMQRPSPQTWATVAAGAARNEAIARPVKAALRNVISKAPAISQQLGMMPMPAQMQAPMPMMPQHAAQPQHMVATMPPNAMPYLPDMQMRAPAAQQTEEAPIFSAEDEAELNRILAANSRAGLSTGDMSLQTGNPAPGAGQAPFPLNLLFGKSGPTQKPANPLMGKPKFGQWHGKNQLAHGGFGHSNITRGKRRKHNNVQRAVSARVSTKRQMAVAQKRYVAPTVAKTPVTPAVPMPAAVAQYPPYTGYYSRPF